MTSPLSPEAVAQMVADDPRLNNVLWLADRATPKLPIGAVPEHFVPGLNAGRVTSVPLSWLPSDIGDAVKEVLRLRALAAENATLQHDYDMATVTAAKFMADAVQRLETAELANATLRAERDALDQRNRDLIDASGQQCGCGYDAPTDVCLGHLPMVNALRASEAAALERITELETRLGYWKQRLHGEFGTPDEIAALTPTADKE